MVTRGNVWSGGLQPAGPSDCSVIAIGIIEEIFIRGRIEAAVKGVRIERWRALTSVPA